MPPAPDAPVILGAGLTGMAISRALSNAGIHHTLVGHPPGPHPRLGESLNLEGTIALNALFPDLKRYVLPKRSATAYLGDWCFDCSFALKGRAFFRALGFTPPDELLHVARTDFDAALYERVVASRHCTVLHGSVAGIEYDAGSDRVASLAIDVGGVLSPSYVFDATNHQRLVARAAGVACRFLGDPQRVAYAHYHLPERARLRGDDGLRGGDELPGSYATSGVRLFAERDGIEAFCWLIPLGNHVSVGISLRDDASTLDAEELLDVAGRAFDRYGLCYHERYTERSRTATHGFRYYCHERAYGANWLLAGPSYCQIWWMGGAGVGSALVAAEMAPRVLTSRKAARAYQRHTHQLLSAHAALDWLTEASLGQLTRPFIARHSDRFVAMNLSRLASWARIRSNGPSTAAGWLLSRLPFDRLLRNYCRVRAVPSNATPSPRASAEKPAGGPSPLT